jgi:hypothetical protein
VIPNTDKVSYSCERHFHKAVVVLCFPIWRSAVNRIRFSVIAANEPSAPLGNSFEILIIFTIQSHGSRDRR